MTNNIFLTNRYLEKWQQSDSQRVENDSNTWRAEKSPISYKQKKI